ncbi:MAG TPA: hypothetical protein VMC84_08700 [Methanocella sp.]|uniref:hypothetical protein n=1 Tax=Methanocella sp. TaxID=2052833 RepID=UPI002C071341|nr:hypothetical protein [Methanocella sp.]HTY91240.1 hypothetical protein [Methanocella sp.]
MGGTVSQEVLTGEKIIETSNQKINYITANKAKVFSRKCEWCPYVADIFCQEGSCDECTVRRAWLTSVTEEFQQFDKKWPVSKN